MTKLSVQKQDLESVVVVATGISAVRLTLAQILNIENVVEIIREALGDYFDQREKYLSKGERFINGYNLKLEELYKKHGQGSKDPAILAFGEEGKKTIEEEVNKPLRELGEKTVDLDIPDEMFDVFKHIYAKEAFFGPKGYNDTESGRASFARVVRVFSIKPEELGPNMSAPSEELKVPAK